MSRGAPPPPLALPAQRAGEVQAGILSWYREGHRDLPWRHTRDPYAILVSEIMLQQTQVDRVLPKYHQFLSRYPSLAALAAAPRAEVIRNWAPLGYNLRAVRLHEIARQAVERHGGCLPDTLEGLLALKGIGPYTAGAVACFAFGLPVAALDTNVRRVLGRIFAQDAPGAGEDDRLAWRLAESALPREHAYDWNQALMDLGATVCVSRNPRCLLCPVQSHCSARAAWDVQDVPPAALTRVAERRGAYGAGARAAGAAPAPRFEGSRRWYRGRIVDALRALEPGATLTLEALGAQVKPDYAPADQDWLLDLVRALARDGLIDLSEQESETRVSLPA